MDQKIKKFYINITLVALGLASVIVVFGFGCGMGFISMEGEEVTQQSLETPTKETEEDDQVVIPGAKTTGLVYANQILRNMSSVTGIKTFSRATLNFYEQNKFSVSEFGSANSLNPPMIMAIMGLGAEVCNDLVSQEGVPNNPRQIFNAIDFSLTPSDIDRAALSETVRRMARSFWGRNETPRELTIISESVFEVINDATTSITGREGTRNLMIYVCSGMLASVEALQI